jgi:hypothetical protein
MAALFIWLWVIGGFPAAVLSEVVRSDSPRVARAGRLGFALLLWVDLLVAALVLSIGADAPTSPMSRSLWWFTVVAAGIPLALVSGLAVRRGYTGRHRLVLVVATLITAGLYVVFPLGFAPVSQHKLTGLAGWEHDHHLLGLAILLIPTLILLADELVRRGEVVAAPEPEEPSLVSRSRAIPRRNIVGGVLFLGVLVWMAGTNSAGMLLGLGVVFAAGGLFLWRKDRLAMRTALRDLAPRPEKP